EERTRRGAEEAARRMEREARDQAEADRLITQAKKQLAKQQFDAALVTLGTARNLHRTEEIDRLLGQAEEGRARAAAQKQGEQAKAEFERRLAEEKARKEKAEAEAKQKQQAYLAALDQAQKALVAQRYDQAIAKYQEADKLYHTDVVANGLKQAQEGKAREAARADAEKLRKAEEQKRADEALRLLTQGRAA